MTRVDLESNIKKRLTIKVSIDVLDDNEMVKYIEESLDFHMKMINTYFYPDIKFNIEITDCTPDIIIYKNNISEIKRQLEKVCLRLEKENKCSH